MIAKKGITFLGQLFLRLRAVLTPALAQAGWLAKLPPMDAQPVSNRLRVA
ncbi:hypothetical protein HA630_21885 [Aquabacterium sp. A08]|nr:hypothetical protein [Aquabacterium sp. A08]